MSDRWASFDCYGTLVDWMSGIRAGLSEVFPEAGAEALLADYHRIEPGSQSGSGRSYREVMAETMAAVAAERGLVVAPERADILARSLPSWPVFPEVPAVLRELRARGWKVAILSNTDPDFLASSIRSIGGPVDCSIVASEIGSYKPAFGHWEAFFRESGADRSRHVHVAASLFHDVEPCAALGLPCVWINRQGETSPVPRAATRPDLADLSDCLDGLVPG